MRDIEFRAKSKGTDKWAYGNLVRIDNDDFLICSIQDNGKTIECSEINPETIGQYIGSSDCTGRRIFEGDILRHADISDSGYDTCVTWHDGNFRMEFLHNTNYHDAGTFSPIDFRTSIARENLIVGNIYDDYDLLEDS